MQTFLPYPNLCQSLACLDNKRLGKQRVEARIIYDINVNDEPIKLGFCPIINKSSYKAWSHHPAVLMWKGYEHFLSLYHNFAILLWKSRGFNNNMSLIYDHSPCIIPPWFGNRKFHRSHKSNLLRKKPEHYKKFRWKVPDNLPYIWPTKEL